MPAGRQCFWPCMVKVKLRSGTISRFCVESFDFAAVAGGPLAGIVPGTDVQCMSRASVKAVLGPTNTGKTHLAIERLCAHSSGMMGFPLRLLAREVYDRVRAIKGDASVGLITGEEKILPPQANWLICTVESMPVERDMAFVAIDEAQLGADPERGHVFTDRMLNVRGREETMILGSATLAPIIRTLVPDAEIINRPRFSSLSYAGPKKLTRLPPRSAIVAFSAEDVYGIAELIRRMRGGSAVVMGALSPRTRNAQVAMFESGEVDYLVATDAIGMGLNLDLAHIAFASLSKFDGKRQRRLHVPEMAQIAGRAGRHQRNGTFGVLAGGLHRADFTDIEIDRIETHRFAPLDHLFWREGNPDFSSLEALAASLDAPPAHAMLRPAPEAVDLAVLRRLADDGSIRQLAKGGRSVARLWEVCGLPDFRHMGADFHAGQVKAIFQHLVSGSGYIPSNLVASELSRLDSVQGDIGKLTARIAAVRTWAYASQRPDWLEDPQHWAQRASVLEQKLSDALHEKLTQRFVDRRTTLLVRSMAADTDALDVHFAEDGAITVEGEPLGRLEGFELKIDHAARFDDRKRLTAAVERRLENEMERRVAALTDAPDRDFLLSTGHGDPVAVTWRGAPLALLARGRSLFTPVLNLSPATAQLSVALRARVLERLNRWFDRLVESKLGPLRGIRKLADDPGTPPAMRAFASQLVAAAGVMERQAIESNLRELGQGERRQLTRAGIVIGALDIFHPAMLKPELTRIRLALLAIHGGNLMPLVPANAPAVIRKPSPEAGAGARKAGYRTFGSQLVRVDLVERVSRALHEQRGAQAAFAPKVIMAKALGLDEATLRHVLRELGFFPCDPASPELWRWRSPVRPRRSAPTTNPSFDALRQWNKGAPH